MQCILEIALLMCFLFMHIFIYLSNEYDYLITYEKLKHTSTFRIIYYLCINSTHIVSKWNVIWLENSGNSTVIFVNLSWYDPSCSIKIKIRSHI